MRRIFLMFLTMTAISLANAQQREAELFLKRWNAAMVAADTAALGAMMDDGIVLHHMSGATQSKREWLDDVQRGTFRYHKVENRQVSIAPQPDGKVRVAFTSAITATVWGSRGTWTLSGTMLLADRNGKWVRIE